MLATTQQCDCEECNFCYSRLPDITWSHSGHHWPLWTLTPDQFASYTGAISTTDVPQPFHPPGLLPPPLTQRVFPRHWAWGSFSYTWCQWCNCRHRVTQCSGCNTVLTVSVSCAVWRTCAAPSIVISDLRLHPCVRSCVYRHDMLHLTLDQSVVSTPGKHMITRLEFPQNVSLSTWSFILDCN